MCSKIILLRLLPLLLGANEYWYVYCIFISIGKICSIPWNLTHFPLNKRSKILQTFQIHFLEWKFLAATKQLYEWFSPSVRPSVRLSVRPSVCHTFLTMFPSSYHHEIFRSYYQWQKWRPCKRSRSEVKGQGHRGHDPNFRFRTVTPVWIHIWWWNDTYSLMLLRRGALLFFKVIRQISRSHGAKIAEFDPDWAFPDCNSSLNSPMAMKCCTKLEVA